MRFTGRIRFDDINHADLDAVVEVTDTHVRLVSGEEVLGSWCLADVVANRKVADEFEIDLGGDTIIFLADDQVNFAYGAVQQMAEGWARYHAMNLLRRKRAVAAARRANEPVRLDEVRRAFTGAREELRRPAPEPDGPQPLEAAPRQEQAVPPDTSPEPTGAHGSAGHVPDVEAAQPPEDGGSRDDEMSDLTGSGGQSRFWDRVERATAGQEPVVEEVGEEPVVEEVGEEPAAPADVPPPARSPKTGRLPRLNAFPRRRVDERPADAAGDTEDTEITGPVGEDEGDGTEVESVGVEPEVASGEVESVADEVESVGVEPEVASGEVESVADEVESGPDQAEVVPQGAEGAAGEAEERDPAEVETNGHRDAEEPAALGSYRDGHHPAETSGLRASLRSIFSRGNGAHEHSMVESTTPGGITRRVCLECGHVSIGVSE